MELEHNYNASCAFNAQQAKNIESMLVYCCHCQHHDHDGATGYCNEWHKWTKMHEFCSRGKRKGE